MNILASLFTLGWDSKNESLNFGNISITKAQIDNLVGKIIRIVLIIIAMYLIIRIGTKLINKFIKRQSNMKISIDEKKARTLGALMKSILRYSVYFFGIASILTQVFGTISLTFAGIGGVAIGFAAQNFVKDVINGFFILFEDQFSVGDYINIGDKGGVVESIGLRLTKLRDFNGDIHIIPNGMISQITNHSRGDMRVLVDVDVDYEEDIDRVTAILDKVCEDFKSNENIVDGPKVIGVVALKDLGFTVRVWAKAKTMTQWECENDLRKEIKKALTDNGIKIPFPRRMIINHENNVNNKS